MNNRKPAAQAPTHVDKRNVKRFSFSYLLSYLTGAYGTWHGTAGHVFVTVTDKQAPVALCGCCCVVDV